MPARKYSDEQRDRFFEVLDRGGTIRAAATSAGVHPDAGQRWVKRAGIAQSRRAPREYTQEDMARFFLLLVERGNVSAVAHELGFVRVTCYKWAHQAGIFTGESADAKRRVFTRLRTAGLTRAEAAEQVGVDRRSAADWDQGIRVFYGGRIYPDGRIVHYRPEQRLAAVTSPRASYVQGEPVDLARVERAIHSKYLSLLERERLHDLHRAGLSMRAIAVELGRAPSTISREMARNTTSTCGYLPYGAHRTWVQRRRRPKQQKLIDGRGLGTYVEARLRKKW